MASTDYMSTWLTNRHAFESLFSAMPSGIVAIDAAGAVVEANPAWSAIAGYGGSLAGLIDAALDAAGRGAQIEREAEIERSDGSRIVVHVRSIPIESGAGSMRVFCSSTTLRANVRRRFSRKSSRICATTSKNSSSTIPRWCSP